MSTINKVSELNTNKGIYHKIKLGTEHFGRLRIFTIGTISPALCIASPALISNFIHLKYYQFDSIHFFLIALYSILIYLVVKFNCYLKGIEIAENNDIHKIAISEGMSVEFVKRELKEMRLKSGILNFPDLYQEWIKSRVEIVNH